MTNKDQVDFEEKNALGGLDRLVTNIGLAIICVFPSLFIALFMPWRLVPLMTGNEPDGRKGIILSPGAFLILALTLVFIIAAALTADDIVSGDGSVVGPRLAFDVAMAASEGNLWKTISIIAPIYAVSVIIGILGSALRPWAGEWWSMRTSLRAAFYFITVCVSWIILWSVVIEYIKIQSNDFALGYKLYAVISIAMIPMALWSYFWYFRVGGDHSVKKAAVLSFSMLVLLVLFAVVFNVIFSKI